MCLQALTLEKQIENLLLQRGYLPQANAARHLYKKDGKPDFEFNTSCASVSYRFSQSGLLISIRKEGAINKLMQLL